MRFKYEAPPPAVSAARRGLTLHKGEPNAQSYYHHIRDSVFCLRPSYRAASACPGVHVMSTPRVLHRPANGWDRKPNYLLPDLVGFVLMMLGGALCFNWLAACIDAVVG